MLILKSELHFHSETNYDDDYEGDKSCGDDYEYNLKAPRLLDSDSEECVQFSQ